MKVTIKEFRTKKFKDCINTIITQRGHENSRKQEFNFNLECETKSLTIRNGDTYDDVISFYYYDGKLQLVRNADYVSFKRDESINDMLGLETKIIPKEIKKRVKEAEFEPVVGGTYRSYSYYSHSNHIKIVKRTPKTVTTENGVVFRLQPSSGSWATSSGFDAAYLYQDLFTKEQFKRELESYKNDVRSR